MCTYKVVRIPSSSSFAFCGGRGAAVHTRTTRTYIVRTTGTGTDHTRTVEAEVYRSGSWMEMIPKGMGIAVTVVSPSMMMGTIQDYN